MEPAIIIHNLSKKYRLQKAAPYVALRDVITNSFKQILRPQKRSTEFWALQDIDLEIGQGERLGIIGSNGAGKSTLLKIISRITPPTKGKIILNGRVASLLEVGTGFHPELTGRENIYLNGSILGLKKKEIDGKLDEIIEFSGVSEFIDVPLKHYSSGMQLRLAFSVAAHLEAEILLIDEVLAVGDMEFQKKCIGKMEEVSRKQGRTIVFISHNMAAIRQLCTSAMVLQKGRQVFNGNVQEAIDLYSKSYFSKTERTGLADFDLRQHTNKINAEEGILSAQMFVDGQPSEEFIPAGNLKIDINYFLKTPLIDPEIGIVIKDEEHNSLIGLNNKHICKKLELRTGKESRASVLIPGLNLFKPGKYRVDLYLGDFHHFYECLYDAFEFTIKEEDVYQSGHLPNAQWNRIFIPGLDIISE